MEKQKADDFLQKAILWILSFVLVVIGMVFTELKASSDMSTGRYWTFMIMSAVLVVYPALRFWHMRLNGIFNPNN